LQNVSQGVLYRQFGLFFFLKLELKVAELLRTIKTQIAKLKFFSFFCPENQSSPNELLTCFVSSNDYISHTNIYFRKRRMEFFPLIG